MERRVVVALKLREVGQRGSPRGRAEHEEAKKTGMMASDLAGRVKHLLEMSGTRGGRKGALPRGDAHGENAGGSRMTLSGLLKAGKLFLRMNFGLGEA